MRSSTFVPANDCSGPDGDGVGPGRLVITKYAQARDCKRVHAYENGQVRGYECELVHP
ncbi:hypothetical protein [Actinomadura rayongensis]|uniref:Uncharacterized protein n=1 Tax=Actinomadura rayongensis TaxID=1429076 RepID=A0A6I4VXX6_9ACTN|nr:hypothetical protein [Actinomadura rayongensis]MXQ63249.1 hypothetical protein [Actinomadura rayongensis]